MIGLIALNGCKTLEIAHAPLDCIDRPIKSLSERLHAQELTELTKLSDKAFDAIEAHIIAHQKRIESQCDLIKKHNDNHQKD